MQIVMARGYVVMLAATVLIARAATGNAQSAAGVQNSAPPPVTTAGGSTGARVLRGYTVSHGVVLAGVNIFDKETLEGSVTAEDGRFSIPVADSTRTTVQIVARHVGYAPVNVTLIMAQLPRMDSVTINLEPLMTLFPISVQAGRYTATAERKTTLTPIEVASIPGSNADIAGAVKTLPGVQNVDEGSGLYVRGGDFTETHMFVDGAPLFSAYQFEAPTGSVSGTINPFLTSSIAFLSGGFGAEWGNVLSGVVDLRTGGRPGASYTNVNASILGVAVSGGVALRKGFGITATLGATDLDLMMRLNGNPRGYSPSPRGTVASALAAWGYSRSGVIKIFALRQGNSFGVPVADPAFLSTFSSSRNSDVVVASWSDSIGVWRPFVSTSTSGFDRDEADGAYQQRTALRSVQARLLSPFVFTPRVWITAGLELEQLTASFDGALPANRYDTRTGAPTVSSYLKRESARDAAFASVDLRPSGRTELIVGVRSNRSGIATQRTTDPRVALAYVPHGAVTLTGSWGLYHQSVDPAFLGRLVPGARLPELRANMAIVGMQVGEELRQFRVEGWTKTYTNLVGFTRTFTTVSGLHGGASGADVFGRMTVAGNIKLRLTYSLSSSRRGDPDTGVQAPAPFDVTHSVTAILQKQWQRGWSAGVAYKVATGRPFTDITSATYSPTLDVYVPQYAAPFADRLPAFYRTDVSVSKQRAFGAGRYAVAFAGINNVFNVRNIYQYTWSSDYTTRLPVSNSVNRTLFVGANLSLQANNE